MSTSKISFLISKSKFIFRFFQFIAFLNKSLSKIEPVDDRNKKNEYLFILSPWMLTATPWFSIIVGLMLYRKNNQVLYVIDDFIFENKADFNLQINAIKVALFFLKKKGIKYELLSSFSSQNCITEEELIEIDKLAFVNAIHKNKGEDESPYFKELFNSNKKKYIANFSTIKKCVESFPQKNFVIPGGILANSGLFQYILKTKNMSFFSFDSGVGLLLTSYKGIAAQLADIPISFDYISRNSNEIEFAVLSAKQELEKRKNGTNKLNSQYQSFEDSLNFDEVGVLVPLNSPWDSAALNICSVFSSYNNWLIETVRIVLENSNLMITIRQHPDERHEWGKSSTDFKKLLAEKFNNNSRIQFVTCHDKVNSYALLEKADAVICYSSTFGIESVIANKSVCVCSNVYYSKLEFAYVPKSMDDIISFVKIACNKKVISNNSKASIAYYLGQQCNWSFTYFTPTIPDFCKWVKMDIDILMKEPVVQTYLQSLEELIPISYVNHKNRYHDI